MTSHGMSSTPEYRAYYSAKQRCTNPRAAGYKAYGGRGIEFRFSSFEEFFAEVGFRPDDFSIDRVDNDGHYEPGNVRWASKRQQLINRRQENVPDEHKQSWKRAADVQAYKDAIRDNYHDMGYDTYGDHDLNGGDATTGYEEDPALR